MATVHGENVVSLGEALFDCLADQKGVPKEEVQSWTPYPGGAPANVACALSRLGVPAVFLSAIGEDELGAQMMALLQERGVDVSGVQRLTRPTRDVLVTRSVDGDREFSGFGKAATNEYADCFLEAGKLPLDKIKGAAVLATGTLGLACQPTAEAHRAAVSAAKEGGTLVVIDVNWRPVFWQDEQEAKSVIAEYLKFADILKFSDTEVEWLLGIPAPDALSSPAKVLDAYPSASGVLVSAGEKGCAYAFRDVGGKSEASGIVPVLEVDVMDTTGAGDAFLAGFLHKLIASKGGILDNPAALKEAVFFATACGAYTTTGPGAISSQPTLTQAEELLSAAAKEA